MSISPISVAHVPVTLDLGTISGFQSTGAYLTSYVANHWIGFGYSVASAVLPGSSLPEIIVGANDPVDGGAVFIMDDPHGGNGGELVKYGGQSSALGYSIAVGNFNGSTTDILIGDPVAAHGSNMINGGYVTAYLDQNAASMTPSFELYGTHGGTSLGSSGDLGDNLGAVVANVGDINGDGLDDFFVSAPGYDSATLGAGSDVGLGYVVYGSPNPSYAGQATSFDAFITGMNGFVVNSPQIAHDHGYTAATGGDFNGDGHRDLILGDSSRGVVEVDLRAAHTAGTTVSPGGQTDIEFVDNNSGDLFGASIAAVDLNNDGKTDLVIGAPGADGGRGAVYIIFGTATAATGTIDINNAAAAGFSVVELLGTGAFGHAVAAAGDANGDGYQDVIVGAPNEGSLGNAYLLLGGAAAATPGYWSNEHGAVVKLSGGTAHTGWAVSTGNDLNSDGVSDVLVTAYNAYNGSSTVAGAAYAVYGSHSFGQSVTLHVANDFNGDGISDILWQSDSGQLTDWLGNSSGGFATNWANASLNVPAGWTIVGSGDFNGDGHSDILLRNGSSGAITDWLSNANGGFSANDANASASVPTSWTVAGIGDFNGDGHADILWRDSSGALTDWLGTGNGGFTSNWANAGTSIPVDWSVIGTGDFNGDGKADVLWRNSAGVVTDQLGNANGGFAANWANLGTGVPSSWHVVGTGDFNGDGIADVLWRSSDGTLVDWLGNANGGFAANWGNAPIGVGSDWHVAEIGDFNGDGFSDVLWRNDNGSVTEWLGNANGGFADNSAHAATSLTTNWHIEPQSLI